MHICIMHEALAVELLLSHDYEGRSSLISRALRMTKSRTVSNQICCHDTATIITYRSAISEYVYQPHQA